MKIFAVCFVVAFLVAFAIERGEREQNQNPIQAYCAQPIPGTSGRVHVYDLLGGQQLCPDEVKVEAAANGLSPAQLMHRVTPRELAKTGGAG